MRRVERELRGKGVTALYLFGSIARDQATPASDVDILIDVDANSRFSLLDQAGVQSDLADALGHPVDVILKKGLRKELRNAVLNEATRVF
ncbi:MAG: DNA polymerase III subunit beta [Alphaproteobacteria bacterium]|nr:DNA polymerase III subunit beta [Alphaproteobacteria bacterium]